MSSRVTVSVLGDCNIDAWFLLQNLPKWYSVTQSSNSQLVAGGKGLNCALAVARLGAHASLLSLVGDDLWGRALCQQIDDLVEAVTLRETSAEPGTSGAVNMDYVLTVPGPTPVCGVLTNHTVPGPGFIGTKELPHWRGIHPIDQWRPALMESDALVFSLEPPSNIVYEAVKIARDAGCLIVMNPGPPPRNSVEYHDLTKILALVDVLVPNQYEARILAARTGEVDSSGSDADLAELLQTAINQDGVALVCVTQGHVGFSAVYYTRSDTSLDTPKIGRQSGKVVPIMNDPVGQGDAYCAALAMELTLGRTPEYALRVARAAASVAVTTQGAAASMPHKAAVEAVMRRERLRSE